ncbi:hypothetical protein GVX81_00705 [[Haemophilus] felis]|uniref:HTH Mu-type domain-containing protein n=1 Tax=[Haemophilus] felis TaxID=123822 RepID=A0A1T0B6W5_9PAST|nr:hypothetical protein [[Haemophilus] felis]OOS05875.1 hypothetical protein B0188_03615 [[Haemophilus] felis]
MKSIKEWFSAKDLEGIDGLPNRATNITRKAIKEGWLKRDAKGIKGGGFEYHYTSLPERVRLALGFDVTDQGFTQKASVFENVSAMHIAGNGVERKEYAFRADWLASKGLQASRLAMLEMKDDGMQPTICKGDRLLVQVFYHNANNQLRLGLASDQLHKLVDGLYLVRINGRASIRRLQIDIQGNVKIKYDNPLYETIEINKESFDPTIIEGRLEWFAHTIDWEI